MTVYNNLSSYFKSSAVKRPTRIKYLCFFSLWQRVVHLMIPARWITFATASVTFCFSSANKRLSAYSLDRSDKELDRGLSHFILKLNTRFFYFLFYFYSILVFRATSTLECENTKGARTTPRRQRSHRSRTSTCEHEHGERERDEHIDNMKRNWNVNTVKGKMYQMKTISAWFDLEKQQAVMSQARLKWSVFTWLPGRKHLQ